MAERLELALLGPPVVRRADQPLGRFRSAKTYALLYYLAVTRRPQPRTVLANLLWADIDEYYARRNLIRTLSDLTQHVGDHLLIDRHSLAFARNQPYWLDVEMLEEAIKIQPTAQNAPALAQTADLYRSEFLEGFYVQDAPEFEQWVLNERTRLRTSVLHLLETLAQFYADQGELTQALGYARRSLQLEPWREETHRQLMLWLAQSGQRSAALAQYELCRQALQSELNVEPDAATLDLVARIRAGSFDQQREDKERGGQGDKGIEVTPLTLPSAVPVSPTSPVSLSPPLLVSPSSPPPAIPHNLPGQRLPFVGRTAELADLLRLLGEDDDCRLLTLIGPGGMGKTRLALKIAEQLVTTPVLGARFADGVFFLALENVSDADGVVSSIITAIAEKSGFPLRADVPPLDQLLHFLRSKALLLVLDNFEHLARQSDLCSTLLATAPHLKLLVTSREALTLQEAWFYPLLGLSFPQTPAEQEAAEEYDAVRLFIQCARRTRPAFTFAAERAAVLEICALVEGMPLGLELAAAWLKVMTCEQIAQEVAHRLDFLTAQYQNLPTRHRSMRVVLEHSWRLLSQEEQAAIARLSIFRGKFRQAAAIHSTGASLFTLATLVEKALLRVTMDGYYQLHELTRQFAAEQLPSSAQTTLRNAHATFYAGLLHQHKPRLFTGTFRQVWIEVSSELDNIRHAWQWLIEAAGAAPRGERPLGADDLPLSSLFRQMADVLTAYHLFHSFWLTGQALFDHACQVLEAAGWESSPDASNGQPSRRAALLKLRICAGQFHFEMGQFRTSLAIATRALADARAFGLEDDLFSALLLYAHTQMGRGAHAEASQIYQEALLLGERLRLPRYRAEILIDLGMLASSQGRYAEAQGYFRQGLTLCKEMDYRPWVARLLTNLGTTYLRQAEYQQALPYYEQALAIAQEEGYQNMIMITTSNLGGVHRGFGQYELALEHYQQSLAMARKLGDSCWMAINLNCIALTHLAMQQLAAAERALHEALGAGQQSDSTSDILCSIGLLGHIAAHHGQWEEALKALLFVEQHPATLAQDKVYNQPLLTDLRRRLSPALMEQAMSWAANQTLDEVVRWSLRSTILLSGVI